MSGADSETSADLRSINQRIVKLEEELKTLKAKRDSLLDLYEEEKTRQIIENRTHESLTVNQKVALFKQLFKGRADVFATRWQNSKGRSGYSVACHNEWVPSICKKPDIKCSECPNRQHKALDDQAIYDHLAGKHIVGSIRFCQIIPAIY